MQTNRRPGPNFSARQGVRATYGEVLVDDETRRRVGRARARRTLAIISLVAIIGGLVAVYLSPLLRVQDVEVTGAQTVRAEEVVSLAGLKGESLLTADLAAAESRIERLPAVRNAAIERAFPQTVRIVIEERTAWGVWQAGEARYVIDSGGVVLAGGIPPEGAPLIVNTNAAGAPLNPGDRVDGDAVTLAQALVEQVPAHLALNVSIVEWSTANGLAVTTDAGYRVVLGDSENMDYKLAVWKRIEEQIGREAMSGHVLDLRFGDRPSFQ